MEKDEMLISDNFGKMLKSLRKKKGLSLEQVASRANLSASYLHRLEKGTRKSPGFTKIIKLAEALKVEPSVLVGVELNSSKSALSISELFFNHTVEHNEEVLDGSTKALLVELIETVLLLKFERDSLDSDLQQLFEIVIDLKKEEQK
ncbi:helix-turn-helix domain-containing protein [Ureibacillus endophyticus]|uniref:XRE family transcriptional regulator n=1 Tax=Ureibacillus endophyticus TaxID=1978490 RepID=A0A494YTD3_9BACL|nr:helix-turn-helix transcriptional regulator [Lysinibacillus endophyticus]RKQ13334.1 XRE family transcriptional regulator [Lysinibacillus endophyticus]